MYQQIQDQIEQAKQQCQNIIILGDFNAKIGARIKGNKETVTKGGTLFQLGFFTHVAGD